MPVLGADAERTLREALEQSGGEEVVGFLLAPGTDEPASFWRLRNHGEQPGVFALDELEVSRVHRAAERGGETVVAFLHSHTSGLELSAADRRSKALTRFPWVVVRLEQQELRWRVHP
jgi:proteasome lid subunit RPN8/RPN11